MTKRLFLREQPFLWIADIFLKSEIYSGKLQIKLRNRRNSPRIADKNSEIADKMPESQIKLRRSEIYFKESQLYSKIAQR
ncbi:hypothetical protein CW306_19565 [Bacillus sp. BA3]|nr:hypothetical protein CW306_19565 [Bacillus sp. BA3]